MDDTGFSSTFPGNLDPRAQEFIPSRSLNHSPSILLSPHVFYSYPCPPSYHNFSPPLPPPVPQQAYVSADPSLSATPSINVSLPLSSKMMPSRTLLLSMVPGDVSESTVRRELEVFGDVRAVQMERLRDGLVTVHFYDLRQAEVALVAIQQQHMQQQFRLRRHYDAVLVQNSLAGLNLLPSLQPFPPPLPPPPPPPARGLIAGRAVWAQFTVPTASTLPGGNNQGTLVIFNLEPEITPSYLKHIFEAFGPIKELRETPKKSHQRFVEFYDIRDAAKALAEMSGKEIHGRHLVIEFSRPGGSNHTKKTSSKATSRGGSMAISRFDSLTNYQTRPPARPPPSPPTLSDKTTASSYDKKAVRFCSKGNSNGNVDSRSSSSSSSKSNVSLQNKMVASLRLDQNGRVEESSKFRPSRSKKNCKMRGGINGINGSSGDTSKQKHQSKNNLPRNGSSSGKSKEYDSRFLINEDANIESNCRDSRTTVMIKNIPNKYSQKLLLNMLDNHCIHCNEQIADGGDDQPLSSYDFVYLPIDFINKCNVGYGFVNMTSPEATLRLYKEFHRQSWEVFNSRKICEVAYARLQGVEVLKEHFKNSNFPCDVDEYMPVVFSPPRDGRRLTEPALITGRSTSTTSPPPPILSCSSTEVNEAVNDHHIINADDQEMYSRSNSNGGVIGDEQYDDGDDVYDAREK